MIYSKLEGTTSTKFKVGKNGIEFTYDKEGNQGLKIYTPKTNAIFELGVNDLEAAGNNDIPTAQAIVKYINETVLNLDLTNVQASLDSLGEVILAIGNDPNFFGNLTDILGSDYVDDNGAFVKDSNFPYIVNTGANEPIPVKGTISTRLTLGETTKVDRRMRNPDGSNYNRLSTTSTNDISNDPNIPILVTAATPVLRPTRKNKSSYIYDTVTGASEQISLDDIRALRPGVYTSNNGYIDLDEVNEKDYIFVHIDHAPNIGEE
jgi:hypothetical protein